MSLRRRLLLALGGSLFVLWIVVAVWVLGNLHQHVRKTLDQRLAASARMVAGLVVQLPRDVWQQEVGSKLSIPPRKGVACQIMSPRGQVLLRTHGGLTGIFRNTQSGFQERAVNGKHWRIFTYTANGLEITVADQMKERKQLQRGIVIAAALPFAVALVGSLIIAWWGIRRGLRPLDRLRGELAMRDPETLMPIEIHDAPGELVPAIETLNHLLERTRETMRREQRFTSDAAHELRTPLTAIKTHLQVARRTGQRDPEQSNRALSRADIGVARLQHTLEQLLVLARIEGGENWPAGERATVTEIVRRVKDDLNHDPRLRVEGETGKTRLTLPVELAVTALRNLLGNALQYSDSDRPVTLRVEAIPQAILFEICDEGRASRAPAKLPSVQRFSRGHDSSGSGLGLSVVEAITARFGGSLDLSRRAAGGLCVRLRLPRDTEPDSTGF